MKTPAPNNSLSARLHATSAPPDPRRLELLERVLSGGREMPGQVLAIFHSDCGLARAYWQELMTAKANAWIGLNEALVARSREELRRWAAGVARDLASRPPEPAVQLAATEQQRVHSLRRALVADHLFATGW
ncbi:MAG TPA: hypothetical protein VL860_08115, partial [Planctomycetota bacterium]|nr:hypothetical protein [Planctomycetota bacterium]